MRFESQTFWLAKDAEFPAEFQDAFALDAERGLAIIADGVSSAIFSGPWARVLVQGTLEDPPRLHDAAHFQDWLARQRAAWSGQIDFARLPWNLRPKMAMGAMSTLLWIELSPLAATASAFPAVHADLCSVAESNATSASSRSPCEPARYEFRGFSIGDCCLFHLRDGQLLRTFPMSSSTEFGLDPKVLGSIDRRLDHLIEFQLLEDTCQAGNLLVLCTDAVGLWAMSKLEQGETVDWDSYWDRSPESWQEEIFELRRSKQMRYDDTTLMLLRMVEETAPQTTMDDAPSQFEAKAEAADAIVPESITSAPAETAEGCAPQTSCDLLANEIPAEPEPVSGLAEENEAALLEPGNPTDVDGILLEFVRMPLRTQGGAPRLRRFAYPGLWDITLSA